MSATVDFDYTAERIVAQFHASEKFVRGIMGPIGSGKSVGCTIEMFSKGLHMVFHMVVEHSSMCGTTFVQLLHDLLATMGRLYKGVVTFGRQWD